MLLLAVLVLTSCGITRTDSPISFSADHRLSFDAPDQEADVELPLRLEWDVDDFPLRDGNRFAVFIDKPPVGPKRTVRLQVCTEGEKLPPQLGSTRKACKDDRTRIYLADDTSLTIPCFEPRFDAPKRQRNAHTATVVLVDGSDRRVGQAATRVRFHVDPEAARQCRGL